MHAIYCCCSVASYSLLNQWLVSLCISIFQDSDEMSGEDTYFPALRVGMEKSSAVVISIFCFFGPECI